MVQLDVRVGIVRTHGEANDLRQEPTGDQKVFIALRFSWSPCYHSHYFCAFPSPIHCVELGYNAHVWMIHQLYSVNFVITIVHILHS